MNRFIDLIIKRYKYALAVIVLITMPLAYFSTKQKFFNHIDIFFNKDDPNMLFYKRFQKMYGNEELAVIIFKDKEIFTIKNIRIIRKITERIENTEGVQRVFSLINSKEAYGTEDTVSFRKIVPDGMLSQDRMSSVKENVLSNDVIVNSLISDDGRTTAILIEIEPIKNNKKKRKILSEIMTSCNEIAGSRVKLHFAGIPYVEAEMNRLSRLDFITFTPFIFLVIFIVVILMLKNLSISMICMLDLFISLIWGIGFFSMCGEQFNMITTVMGAVLLAIAVADSIHIMAHYRNLYLSHGVNHTEAVRNTIRSLWLPCLLTSLTTGVGFFSFITSSISPVKTLGIFTASGVMFDFAVSIAFMPAALIFLRKRLAKMSSQEQEKENASFQSTHENIFDRILIRLGRFTTEYSGTISIALVAVLIITLLGALQIDFETNTMNYIPKSNRIRADVDFVDKNLGGTIPFVMLIRAKSKEFDFTHYKSLKMIDDIQTRHMREIKQFTTTFSIANYFKEINRAFNSNKPQFYRIPLNESDILDFYEIGDAEVFERIISPDMMEARISFQSRWDSNETARNLHKEIVIFMEKTLGDNFTYKITGLSSLYLNMEFNLKDSQIKSFLLAFIIILLMMFFVCRNFKLTMLSMIPNIFPIVLTMGIMGWFSIPLDVSTIMIASVTIGIAVDDTIHFIIWFRRNILSGMDIKSSIIQTYRDTGKPITITSLVLFLGFFVLILGSIKPTQAFGLLTALSMLFALIGDLLILPALLLVFKPKIVR